MKIDPPIHSPPLPLLITGVAGVAGFNALEYFSERYPEQVVGMRQEKNWPLTGPNVAACDAEDYDALSRLFDKHEFRAVLNCAGNCALKSCELDSRLAWRTNVEGVTNLAAVVAEREVRLVHTSVDLVFGGEDDCQRRGPAGYTEDALTNPVTVYGKTMVSAEQLLADWFPESCTLRISLPMGISFNGHAGAIDWIQSRFAKNAPATLYYDEVRTPTYTDCLNRVYEQVLASDLSGLYHAGGPRRLSLFETAQVINRVGGYDPQLLQGCQRIEAGPIPPRAGDVTLDSTRLSEALGREAFDPWPYDDALVPTDREWHYQRGPECGSPELLAEVLYRNPQCRKVVNANLGDADSSVA